MDFPSGLTRGGATPWQVFPPASTRVGALDPSEATIARCSMLYAPYFLSSPSRKVIQRPSWLHSTRDRPARLVGGVNCFSVTPGFASATNIWLDGSRSGSAE